MGQTKGGGYEKLDAITGGQKSMLDQIMAQVSPYLQQAAGGYQQFLPGGGGGQAMINQANQNFQQQTIPSIMNAMGSGAKTSSALNQALGASGANLNTDLAAMLSQAQLGASQGLGQLGMGQAQLGAGTNQFALMPKQQPFWQQMLLAGTAGGSQMLGSYLGKPKFK